MEINGIAVSEVRLLGINILFTVLLLVCAVVFVVVLHVFRDEEHKKAKDRLRQLKVKPNKGPSTYRNIQKLQRKIQKNKGDRRTAWLTYVINILLIVALLVFCVIPGWTDYVLKDYVVYEGSFTCEYHNKVMCVILDDGTTLTGSIGLAEGTYNGQIVYAKRSKMTLGGKT